MTAATLTTATLVRLGEISNRTFVLPLVIFYPTSRCNSRCVSCDWWKQTGEHDLSLGEIDGVAAAVAALGTRLVVFSGGEPLLRPEVFEAARRFRARGLTLHLLTSGVLLERFADRVAEQFARVCISLDAADAPLYERVRGVDALPVVQRGVRLLHRLAPEIPVTARSTLHRRNFLQLPRLIDRASAMGLDGISFLPADVLSAGAFGREARPDAAGLMLDHDDVEDFEAVVERTIVTHADAFASGFVAESAERLRRLPRYYRALAGDGPFPPVTCNAPWVSIVIEANGQVRPCFFHEPIGNLRDTPLADIVGGRLRTFRQSLCVETDATCERCVCSLKTGWRRTPWTS